MPCQTCGHPMNRHEYHRDDRCRYQCMGIRKMITKIKSISYPCNCKEYISN